MKLMMIDIGKLKSRGVLIAGCLRESKKIMKAKLSLEQYELITKLGKSYKPALLPKDIKRFPIGKCFDGCAIQALYNRKYRYVEGICKPSHEDRWFLHAWLTDGIHAFDPTWAAIDEDGVHHPIPAEYIGIEMDIVDVARFMKETEYQGVIANRWRNEELAAAALESRL